MGNGSLGFSETGRSRWSDMSGGSGVYLPASGILYSGRSQIQGGVMAHMAFQRGLVKILMVGMFAVAGGCGGSGGDVPSTGPTNYPTPRMQRIVANRVNADIIREALAKTAASGAAAGPVAEVAKNDGWADLKGVFRVEGQPPAQMQVDITKDREVCQPGGKTVFDESIVLGSDNGLANVLIFVSSKVADDWEHEQYKADAEKLLEADLAFDQKNCVFKPHVYAMRSKQKLKILNSDPIGHNTNISEFGFNETIGASDSTIFAPGSETRSPFQVRCSIHPWMKAWMITRGNPYFAVTAADGSFTIPKVPAGVELEFRVWHERSKLGAITINGTSESGGKFKRKLQKDQPLDLTVLVDAGQFE